MNKDDIVIVAGARTPMGSFQGGLSGVSAVELGAISLKAAMEKGNVDADEISEIIMGCVLPAGLGQGPARRASRKAGIPDQYRLFNS